MATNTPITVAKGDGIGPEIMDATLHILKEAGARLDIEEIEIGEKVYLRGNTAGIEKSSIESMLRTKVFLKAPITTPQGGGYKSLNVTTRKMLGLYANVRPCVAYDPYIPTKHPGMNVVIVRENEEDLYAGIEHQQTPDVTQCLKLITRSGSERIVRYAFEYAIRNNRKKVTVFMKDNIMKLTDGLFIRCAKEIHESEFPQIAYRELIIDAGCMRLVQDPARFDVLLMENLYGDVVSDLCAGMVGGLGVVPGANIGDDGFDAGSLHPGLPLRRFHETRDLELASPGIQFEVGFAAFDSAAGLGNHRIGSCTDPAAIFTVLVLRLNYGIESTTLGLRILFRGP